MKRMKKVLFVFLTLALLNVVFGDKPSGRLEFLGLRGTAVTALDTYNEDLATDELSLAIGTQWRHVWYKTRQGSELIYLPYTPPGMPYSPEVSDLKVLPTAHKAGIFPKIFIADPVLGVKSIVLFGNKPKWHSLGLKGRLVKNILVEEDRGTIIFDDTPYILFVTGTRNVCDPEPRRERVPGFYYKGTHWLGPAREGYDWWTFIPGPVAPSGEHLPIQAIAVEFLKEAEGTYPYRIYLGTEEGVFTYSFDLAHPPKGQPHWQLIVNEDGTCPKDVVAMKFLPAGMGATTTTLWVVTKSALYVGRVTRVDMPWVNLDVPKPCKCNPRYTSLDVEKASEFRGTNLFRVCLGRTTAHKRSAVYGIVGLPEREKPGSEKNHHWLDAGPFEVPLDKDVISVAINFPPLAGTCFDLYLGTKDGLYRYTPGARKHIEITSLVVEKKIHHLKPNPFPLIHKDIFECTAEVYHPHRHPYSFAWVAEPMINCPHLCLGPGKFTDPKKLTTEWYAPFNSLGISLPYIVRGTARCRVDEDKKEQAVSLPPTYPGLKLVLKVKPCKDERSTHQRSYLFELKVTNISQRDITIPCTSGPFAIFAVVDENGEVIMRGERYLHVITTTTFPPNATRTYYYTWERGIPSAGKFLVQGAIGNANILSAPVELVIESVAVDEVQKMAATTTVNYPNPFNPECYIPINTKGKVKDVKCKIYNILGQLVREIEYSNGQEFKGSRLYWDGRDSRGLEVPAGVYFYEVAGGGVKRMVVLR
jgi:hypothetical protein